MNLVRTTAPAVEPLTLTEVKAHLRVSADTEDAHIAALLGAATDYVETSTGRALITQTWTRKLDDWPKHGVFRLPRPPLQSVTALRYLDSDGNQQTWDAANYRVSTGEEPGRLSLAYNISLPTLRGVSDQVEVEYVAGYGDSGEAVPLALLQAVLLLVGHWFENREGVVTGTISTTLPLAVDSLLTSYRVVWPW